MMVLASSLSHISQRRARAAPSSVSSSSSSITLPMRTSESEAAAIVRVARDVARTSGGTEDFLITREFERTATREEKLHLLDCLFEIGAADASILIIEDNEIRRVASELKLDHTDFINVRRRHLEHLEVLKRRQYR